jgi:adenosylcobinamide-phosphate synthase
VNASPSFFGLKPDPRMLAVAIAIDLLFGDPPNAVHPVAWMGRLTNALVRRAPSSGPRRQLGAGAAIVLGLFGACIGALVVLALATASTPTLAFWLGAAVLTCMFAINGLGAAGRVVRDALANGRVSEARQALSALCSRDAAPLEAPELAAATVESLAENLSDSFVAPLLAYAIFGLPGAVIYRAANTLDAMIGYRGQYEYLGKAAARLDDLLNLLPARITAGLVLAAGALTKADVGGGLRILRRDRLRTASPNAGWPMATMAGLLGVCLSKPGHYRLGDEERPVTFADINRAWRLVSIAAGLATALALLIAVGRSAHGL